MEGAGLGYSVSMSRVVLAAVVVSLLLTPVTSASTVGVLDDPDALAVAPAGPDLIVQRQTDRAFSLWAVPRAGGRAERVLTVKPVQFTLEEPYRLAASASRVALIAELVDRRDDTVEWRVYSGPPRGPYTVIRSLPVREAWVPMAVSVDGDRVLIVEGRQEPDGPVRAFLYEPATGLAPLPWASAAKLPLKLAGPYAAVLAAGPERAAVIDVATGAEVAAIPMAERNVDASLGLAPDGRLALGIEKTGVTLAGPGAPPRLLAGTRDLKALHLTGETVAGIFDREGRAVAVPAGGGRVAPIGLPTGVFTHAAGDAQGYAWIANGCVWHATIPITPGTAAGPCPTTEIGLAAIDGSRLSGRTVRASVWCVTAPSGVCRGTVLGRDDFSRNKRAIVARGRFAVPVGKSRRVKMTVTAATAARWRREKSGGLILSARIPNGRLGQPGEGNSELNVQGLE